MSVHARVLPSGRKVFEVRYRDGDTNRSKAFDTKKDANQYDRELRLWRQRGELDDEIRRRQVTVNDLYADWMKRTQPSLSAKAAATYGTQLDLRILPEFGVRKVVGLKVSDVERWIAKMRKKGAGDPTILMACAVLQALLSMAVRDGVIQANVVAQARKPKQARTRTPYLIKPISVERMRLTIGGQRDVVLTELLAYAGLRPESEAIKLRWRDVRERSILVKDTKRGRERSIPMLEPLAVALSDWRRESRGGTDDLVIPAPAGDEWTEHHWRSWRRGPFRRAALVACLPRDARPRDLRGSFASLLIHEGRSIVEVASQLGHSPTICLRDYAQVLDEFDPAKRKPAHQIIAEARLAVRIAAMRPWAEEVAA